MEKPETPTTKELNEPKVPEQQTNITPTTSVVGSVSQIPQNSIPEKIPFLRNRKLLKATIVFLAIYLVLLTSDVVIKVLDSKNKSVNLTPVSPAISLPTGPVGLNTTPIPTIQAADLADRYVSSIELGQITWYENPKTISSAAIFNSPAGANAPMYFWEQYHPEDATYLEVASTSKDQKIILALLPTEGMGIYNTIMRFIKTSDGKYVYMEGSAKYFTENDLPHLLLPEVKITKQKISDLEISDKEIVEGITYTKITDDHILFSDLKDIVKVAEDEHGTLYRADNSLWIDDFYARKFYLALKDSTLAIFNLKVKNITDNLKQDIVWSDGVQAEDDYTQMFISGCGNTNLFHTTPVIPNNSDLIKSAIEIGKDKEGNPALQIKSSTSPFVKALYEEVYKVGRDPSYSKEFLTLEEFAEKRNHYLFQDPSADWQLFVNQSYAPMAECAKPVIYLYPKKETEVFVKVGADIKESEPIYKTDGWKVTAYPSGKLISNGVEYDYLFWDGRGMGEYPDYRNYGFLVEQDDVEKTLRLHLSKLGLNDRESNDFLEYWLPLIPESPYVRLTWLKTQDLNKLAPLSVFPKPDTEIRVFLEFEGLSEYNKLIPQKLTSIPRNGFTLVEWGGLLVKVKD